MDLKKKSGYHQTLGVYIKKFKVKLAPGEPKYLSRGASGHVYLLDNQAIKVIPIGPNFDIMEVTRELYTSSLVAPRSPYLMPTTNMHIINNHLLMVMPFASMGTINSYIPKLFEVLPQSQSTFLSLKNQLLLILRIFAQSMCGLQCMHDHGLLHLDLKPSNIFVSGDVLHPLAQLGDFGLTIWNGTDFHRKPQELITSWWRPPEMLRRKNIISKAADIWSMAIILMQMLGNWMFHAEKHGTLHFKYGYWFEAGQWVDEYEVMNAFRWEDQLKDDPILSSQHIRIHFIQNVFFSIMFGASSKKDDQFSLDKYHAILGKYLNLVPKQIWLLLYHMLRIHPHERLTASKITQQLDILNLMPHKCPVPTFVARECHGVKGLMVLPSVKTLNNPKFRPIWSFLHKLYLHEHNQPFTNRFDVDLAKVFSEMGDTKNHLRIPDQSQCVIDGFHAILDTLDQKCSEELKVMLAQDRWNARYVAFVLSVFLHWSNDKVWRLVEFNVFGFPSLLIMLEGIIAIIRAFKKYKLEPVWSIPKKKTTSLLATESLPLDDTLLYLGKK